MHKFNKILNLIVKIYSNKKMKAQKNGNKM